MNTVLQAALLFIPAGIANMAPVFANVIPGINRFTTPMDFGMSYKKHRILGDHKTWRGFIIGSLCGGLVGALLLPWIEITTTSMGGFALGVGMGAGALIGDAIKSFFKRRIQVRPGGTWFPFDQIDYIVGGLLALVPFGIVTPTVIITVSLLYFVAVIISTHIGYWLGLKDSPL